MWKRKRPRSGGRSPFLRNRWTLPAPLLTCPLLLFHMLWPSQVTAPAGVDWRAITGKGDKDNFILYFFFLFTGHNTKINKLGQWTIRKRKKEVVFVLFTSSGSRHAAGHPPHIIRKADGSEKSFSGMAARQSKIERLAPVRPLTRECKRRWDANRDAFHAFARNLIKSLEGTYCARAQMFCGNRPISPLSLVSLCDGLFPRTLCLRTHA